MEKIIEGRIVHYVLSESDANKINRRRADWDAARPKMGDRSAPDKLTGFQAHVGGRVDPGDHVPAMIVLVHRVDSPLVNLKCFLNGNDDYWVPDVHLSNASYQPQTWHWIEGTIERGYE